VTKDRRLPAVSPKTRRLWGDFPAGDAEVDYVPAPLLLATLERLGIDGIDRILPSPIPPLQVVVGIVHAINADIESAKDDPKQAERTRLMESLLRRVLDDAAGDKPGVGNAIAGLAATDFERLLSAVEDCKNSYGTTPGNFGDRIARFVKGFHGRVGEVCADKRLIKLAAAWAECSAESEQLLDVIRAWNKVLRMFASHDTSGSNPWRVRVSEDTTGPFLTEVSSNAKVIIPGDAIFDDKRRQLMRRIVEEFVKRGWLKVKSQGNWWPRSQSTEHPLMLLIDDAFKSSR
jgi:hypothetical protein